MPAYFNLQYTECSPPEYTPVHSRSKAKCLLGNHFPLWAFTIEEIEVATTAKGSKSSRSAKSPNTHNMNTVTSYTHAI